MVTDDGSDAIERMCAVRRASTMRLHTPRLPISQLAIAAFWCNRRRVCLEHRDCVARYNCSGFQSAVGVNNEMPMCQTHAGIAVGETKSHGRVNQMTHLL